MSTAINRDLGATTSLAYPRLALSVPLALGLLARSGLSTHRGSLRLLRLGVTLLRPRKRVTLLRPQKPNLDAPFNCHERGPDRPEQASSTMSSVSPSARL